MKIYMLSPLPRVCTLQLICPDSGVLAKSNYLLLFKLFATLISILGKCELGHNYKHDCWSCLATTQLSTQYPHCNNIANNTCFSYF